jgi:sialidase-1
MRKNSTVLAAMAVLTLATAGVGHGAQAASQAEQRSRRPSASAAASKPREAGTVMNRKLSADHGIVCRLPEERFGYFGWPTVARMEDGTLLVASSGLRMRHVCPFGKTVLNVSKDDGRTWSAPRVIQDSLIDDRDAGIVSLGGGGVLATWFRSDTRQYTKERDACPLAERQAWAEALAAWTDEKVRPLLGSWVMLSDDAGATWSAPVRAPVSAPHGPIRLRNGDLLYVGKRYGAWKEMEVGAIAAARSADGGRTWKIMGDVPLYAKTDPSNYHEPHVVELPSGRLIGMIRIENSSASRLTEVGIVSFSLMQTESDDGGRTWTQARPLGFHGSPPHLLRHSCGVLILSYGYRQRPFGQRVALSRDDGRTWEHDWIIRDDGADGDLGYPSTVELADGSLLTVYYQKAAKGEKDSLLWSRWRLPWRKGSGVFD